MNSYDMLQEKWKPVLNHASLPTIADSHRKSVTAIVLENTERALREDRSYAGMLNEASPTNSMGASSSTASDGSIDIFDPVLISLVRRSMPNLIAYDVCGVQPMSGPTGLIFAMRAKYSNQTGTEAFYNEPDSGFATIVGGANTFGDKHVGGVPGNTTATANLAETGLYNFGDGMITATQEALGSNSSLVFPEMAFSIEKVTVTALGRALKAEYSLELAQDLKAVHGLDAEGELSNILSTELLAEINREVIRTINITALRGAVNTGTTTAGIFDLDTDSNGRWSVEKFKGLMMHIELEANEVAKATRRGKANIIICSSNVASALQMAGNLDYTPALNSNNLNVDDTGVTFAGVLNGRFRVYIDPYATGNYITLGYKGANSMDAGLFYCPYVPLQQVRAVDPNTFQPKIGFKTRYGMVSNPFSSVTYANGLYSPVAGAGALVKDANAYYRRILVTNIM